MQIAVMPPEGFPLNEVSATQITATGTIQKVGELICFLSVALNKTLLDNCTLIGNSVAFDSIS